MRAGLLQEIIEFYKPTIEKTETGSEENSFVLVHTCRSRVTYTGGDRTNENGDIFYSRHITFEIRRGYSFDELYRIKWDGDYYRILSIEKDKSNMSIKIVTDKIND